MDFPDHVKAVESASDLDALRTALNAACESLPPEELNHLVEMKLPTFGPTPRSTIGNYSWDDTRFLVLDNERFVFEERDDI